LTGAEEQRRGGGQSASEGRVVRTRDAVAGGLMVIQGLVLFVLALLSVAVPHSCVRGCGGGIAAVTVAAVVTGLVVIAGSGALLSGARRARPLVFALDAVLATGAAVALAVTFAQASPDDRSTYASLWVMAGLLVLLAAAPTALMWPPRARQ
jgi:hypothetical protein